MPPYQAPVSAEDVAHAEALLAANVTISLHDHPVRFPADMANTPATTAPVVSTRRTKDWQHPA